MTIASHPDWCDQSLCDTAPAEEFHIGAAVLREPVVTTHQSVVRTLATGAQIVKYRQDRDGQPYDLSHTIRIGDREYELTGRPSCEGVQP